MNGGETHKPGRGGYNPGSEVHELFCELLKENSLFHQRIKEVTGEDATGQELLAIWSPYNRPTDLPPTKISVINPEANRVVSLIHEGLKGQARTDARELVWPSWDEARRIAASQMADVIEITLPQGEAAPHLGAAALEHLAQTG